jgi:hypothetical protein
MIVACCIYPKIYAADILTPTPPSSNTIPRQRQKAEASATLNTSSVLYLNSSNLSTSPPTNCFHNSSNSLDIT